jgi:drug/metabolite transporter (DMT)-like permease
MRNWPWYLSALGAAIVWGVHYPLVDNALKRVSTITVLLLTAIPIFALALAAHRTIGEDFATLRALRWRELLPIFALALTSLAGSILLYVAISARNATLASVIEISYPLFVAIFAWVMFRQAHWNLPVVAGGLLVFAGVALIIINNR